MLQSSLRTLGLSEKAVGREREEPLLGDTRRGPVPAWSQEPEVLIRILLCLRSWALLPGREATSTRRAPVDTRAARACSAPCWPQEKTRAHALPHTASQINSRPTDDLN